MTSIENRLGWLDLPTSMRVDVPRLEAFFVEVEVAGLERAVLLGMGGSSLAAETMAQTLDVAPNHLPLTVLDSTDPAQVQRAAGQGPLERTLFIVASKSGTTAEVDALYRYFRERLAAEAKPQAADEHAPEAAHRRDWRQQFVAITDPGTPLEKLACAEGFRAIYLNPPDIGGRFSALSLFGLPAALVGVDLRATPRACPGHGPACRATVPPAENPGIVLGSSWASARATAATSSPC